MVTDYIQDEGYDLFNQFASASELTEEERLLKRKHGLLEVESRRLDTFFQTLRILEYFDISPEDALRDLYGNVKGERGKDLSLDPDLPLLVD